MYFSLKAQIQAENRKLCISLEAWLQVLTDIVHYLLLLVKHVRMSLLSLSFLPYMHCSGQTCLKEATNQKKGGLNAEDEVKKSKDCFEVEK